jgi:hypothetical protein
MTNLVKRLWLLLPFFALALQTSWGQSPSGTNFLFFGTPTTAVYDLTGTYTFTQNIIGSSGTLEALTIGDVVLTLDRSGRWHGTGEIWVSVGSAAPVAAHYNANGHVSGGGGKPTRAQLSITLNGRDTLAGVGSSFNISVRYNLFVDPGTMALEGSAKGHVSFSKLSGGRIDTDSISVPLQSGVDGTWSAQLDLVALNRLGGSGSLVLSNGRSVPVKVAGNFVSTSGLSKIHCSGQPAEDGRGNAVQLGFFAGTGTANTVNGTILGQKVRQ